METETDITEFNDEGVRVTDLSGRSLRRLRDYFQNHHSHGAVETCSRHRQNIRCIVFNEQHYEYCQRLHQSVGVKNNGVRRSTSQACSNFIHFLFT
uniref:Uncharacterized protein n=1 Tax=Trichobilharzia regenti TaxID=157069 RepID=A0AA85ITL1_TRIRE|nr:unnamed protein product [Trichobilharzia regenti]